MVTFKKIKINCVDVGERGRRGWVWVDRGRGRGNRGGETEVREREKERAEGGVKGGRGGGFVLGMQGRSSRGEEELDIHQGEDFST